MVEKRKFNNIVNDITGYFYKEYCKANGGSLKKIKSKFKSRNFFQPIVKPLSHNKSTLVFNKYPCIVYRPKKPTNNKAIMYIHGGAFISQITLIHWSYINRLAKKTNATVYIPIYPLCTENYSCCLDTIKFLIEIYKVMLKEFNNNDITIMGDSAGGQLTLTLGQQIKINKLPAAKNLIMFSPGTKCDIKKQDILENMDKEPILPAAYMYYATKWYVKKGDDPKKPIYSPLYGDCKNIGKMTIVVGTKELLMAHADELHLKLQKQKISHTYEKVPNMFHAFPVFLGHESSIILKKVVNLILNNKWTINN